MSGHTPGPWKVHRSELLGGFSAITDANGEYILFSPLHVSPLHDSTDQLDTHLADMDLAAAAPDLLDLLKTIENDSGQVPEWLWIRIQAAIAKAEGGTP